MWRNDPFLALVDVGWTAAVAGRRLRCTGVNLFLSRKVVGNNIPSVGM